VRRRFPQIWFNETTTQPGREALGWYHEKKDDARNVGLGPEHDWSSHGCFHGHTEVLTRYGLRRIMDLPENGEVLTPCGWKQYINPRMTKRAARLVAVEFVDGYSVKCTPDHLFLTESGWKSAESLTTDTVILSSLMKSRSISVVAYTVFGRLIGITQKAVAGFTGMFGKLRLALSQTGATFTTGMEIALTTESRILSALTLKSTYGLSAKQGLSTRKAGSAPQQEKRRLSGTGQMLVENGTGVTQRGPKVGLNGSESQRTVLSVARCLMRSFAKAVMRRCIAVQPAKLLHTVSAGRQTNTPLRIERVRPLNETADVWDITVPDGHWFSLANGAVVHNSDAFGLMCVVYQEPRSVAPLDYSKLNKGIV